VYQYGGRLGLLVTCKSRHRDRAWQAVVMMLMFPGCWPVAGLSFACGMCSWELQTYWMFKKILTSEINFSVFMANLIALKSSLLMFFFGTLFNIQQYYVLPTQCIYVFCVDLRTNSDYFPIQH
jgi:hypothetical protein